MADSRSVAENIQNDPVTFCGSRKQGSYHRALKSYQKNKRNNLKGIALAKDEKIWAPKRKRTTVDWNTSIYKIHDFIIIPRKKETSLVIFGNGKGTNLLFWKLVKENN